MKKAAAAKIAIGSVFPGCPLCPGTLLPISDFARDGASVTFKAWTCSNPRCAYTVRIDGGKISRTFQQTE